MTKRVKKLSDHDRKVWRNVTKTITPYHDMMDLDDLEFVDEMSESKTQTPSALKSPKRAVPDPYQPQVQKPKLPKTPAGLNPIERKVHRKIAKGRVAIDSRIDLHGMTQQVAHHALMSFLSDCYDRGDRHVLVITGKGISSGGQGILRQAVPEWFTKPEFKMLVSGFKTSARHHGGDGALYVRLRQRSERNR